MRSSHASSCLWLRSSAHAPKPPLTLPVLLRHRHSLQIWLSLSTWALGFNRLFPGLDCRLLTLAINFRNPLLHAYLLWNGAFGGLKAGVRVARKLRALAGRDALLHACLMWPATRPPGGSTQVPHGDCSMPLVQHPHCLLAL